MARDLWAREWLGARRRGRVWVEGGVGRMGVNWFVRVCRRVGGGEQADGGGGGDNARYGMGACESGRICRRGHGREWGQAVAERSGGVGGGGGGVGAGVSGGDWAREGDG